MLDIVLLFIESLLIQISAENESVSTSNEIKLSDSEMAEAIQAEAGIHEDDVAVAMMVTNDDDDDFPDVTQKIQVIDTCRLVYPMAVWP